MTINELLQVHHLAVFDTFAINGIQKTLNYIKLQHGNDEVRLVVITGKNKILTNEDIHFSYFLDGTQDKDPILNIESQLPFGSQYISLQFNIVTKKEVTTDEPR